MKRLNEILESHLGKGDYAKLKKELKAWHNTPLQFKDKEKVIENLIKVINISFDLDCRASTRQHSYIAARLCFYTCVKKLYPSLSKKETVAYVGMKQHGTLDNAIESQRSFFSTYTRFKKPYNRVARKYKIPTV